jgi:hypothetical protein
MAKLALEVSTAAVGEGFNRNTLLLAIHGRR